MPHHRRSRRRLAPALATLATLALALPALAGPPSYDDIITLGFTDAEHTRDDGWQQSGLIDASPAGYVAGFSYRYDGPTQRGRSNWLHDGTSLHRVGFTDTDHTRTDGHRWSHIQAINDVGQAAGYSTRYDGSATIGRSAWIDDGTTTTRLGLIDAEHTAAGGGQRSEVHAMNNAGQVIGFALRYLQGAPAGESAWIDDGTQVRRLGFTDAEHTSASGWQLSHPDDINDAGHTVGWSERYDPVTGWNGQSAWLDTGTTITRLGYTDADHTDAATGFQDSSITAGINAAGLVGGTSLRYDGDQFRGKTAWLDDGSHIQRVGLIDTEHTRDDGTQDSQVTHLNDAGKAVGFSTRYDGSSWHGFTAWVQDGAFAERLGLTDAVHTRADGLRDSRGRALNEAGHVLGTSNRYDGSTFAGQSAWLYDPTTDVTHELVFSVTAAGYAQTSPMFLSEGGVVVGSFEKFDAQDNLLGQRGFYWSADHGFHELAELLVGDPGDFGFSALTHAEMISDLGHIVGHGPVPGGPLQTPFIMIPEPGTLALLGAAGLLAMRRRHDREA